MVTSRHNSQEHREPSLALTARDLALLAFIAANRAVPVDLLAARFFADNPQTGRASAQPVRACERRVQLLAKAGYVWLIAFHDGNDHRDVAMLGPASGGITGKRPGRVRIPPRKRAHHVRTLDALDQAAVHREERRTRRAHAARDRPAH